MNATDRKKHAPVPVSNESQASLNGEAAAREEGTDGLNRDKLKKSERGRDRGKKGEYVQRGTCVAVCFFPRNTKRHGRDVRQRASGETCIQTWVRNSLRPLKISAITEVTSGAPRGWHSRQ